VLLKPARQFRAYVRGYTRSWFTWLHEISHGVHSHGQRDINNRTRDKPLFCLSLVTAGTLPSATVDGKPSSGSGPPVGRTQLEHPTHRPFLWELRQEAAGKEAVILPSLSRRCLQEGSFA
jgi:hypothetical protein